MILLQEVFHSHRICERHFTVEDISLKTLVNNIMDIKLGRGGQFFGQFERNGAGLFL